MFSTGHIIWIILSFLIVSVSLFLCLRNEKITLRKVLIACLAVGIISEVVKIVSVMEIVPVVDLAIEMQNGKPVPVYVPIGQYTPMMGAEHLPYELCTLQLFFIVGALIMKDEKKKHILYAIMYPTGLLGGLMGIVLAAITAKTKTLADYFLTPRVYQFFLYHCMVIFMSLYISFSKEADLSFRDLKTALFGILLMDIPTFYLNSVFSAKVYVHEKLAGVTHGVNFFSSYINPLGLVLTEKWQWLVYLLIRFVMAFGLVVLVYLPFRKKKSADDIIQNMGK